VAPATAEAAIVAAPLPRAAASFSKGYRRYVMALLLVGCTLNFLDRGVINILAEPIRQEFHLMNWQLG
jgi:hypothetical protein